MKNILRNYREFINGRKKAQEDLEKGMKALKKDYTGDVYAMKVTELKKTFERTMNDLKNKHIPAINAEYETARKQVRGAITKPIPADVLNVLNSMKGMTLSEVERQELLNLTEKNYLARRQAVDILGNDYLGHLPQVDRILAQIDELEQFMGNTIRRDSHDYMTAVMENGDWVNRVDGETSAFIDTYR